MKYERERHKVVYQPQRVRWAILSGWPIIDMLISCCVTLTLCLTTLKTVTLTYLIFNSFVINRI